MRLARAEWRRLFKRRFTRYMMVIVILLLGTIAAGMFLTNHKVTPAEIAAAQQRAEREYQNQVTMARQVRDECQTAKQSGDTTHRYPGNCDEIVAPQRDQIQAEWYMPPTFNFRGQFDQMIVILTAILALAAFAIGASYIGAEWHSGGMMNLLLWQPRRLRVFASKLGTLLGGLIATWLVLAASWTAAFWGIATVHGSTRKMTPGAWQSFALTGLRGAALVLVLGAIGFALASLGRHTAMALGAAIGVLVVGQVALTIALQLAKVRYWEAWLLPTYVSAWMGKQTKVLDYRSCELVQGACQPKSITITMGHSAWLFGVTALVLVILAAWTMRRRDIT